ncbi:MAG: hypothetical protein IJM59_08080 [Proteobacteria bacterium]|nr:hypothetical protein [Pseudomonadota bacterium]
MSPFYIYRKTVIFSWIKLCIGLLTLLVCLAIGGITWMIISNMAFELTTSIAIGCSAFLIAVVVYYVIMGKLGYSIQMGHLAIIERAQRGEDVPPNPIQFSKNIVSERFGGNRQFYTYSRDIGLTVRQLARVIARGFSLDKDTPELGSGRWIKHIISTPARRCADECCIAYALRRNDYEITAACVDALTILIQDWSSFSKKAFRLSIMHIVFCLLVFAIIFTPGIAIFSSIGSILPWLAASILITLTVKIAFLDSYVLTKIVCDFLAISDEAKIEQKNYVKLDSWSKGYAKLRKNAEKISEKAEDDADKAESAAKKAAKKAKKEAAALPEEVAESDETPEDESMQESSGSDDSVAPEVPESPAEPADDVQVEADK